MSKYLRKFDNEAAYSAATIYTPSVSLIADTMVVKFDPYVPPTPTPTGTTYEVTIDGLGEGVTTTITWGEEHTTSGASNGTYTYTSTSESLQVSVPVEFPGWWCWTNPVLTLTPEAPTGRFSYQPD